MSSGAAERRSTVHGQKDILVHSGGRKDSGQHRQTSNFKLISLLSVIIVTKKLVWTERHFAPRVLVTKTDDIDILSVSALFDDVCLFHGHT